MDMDYTLRTELQSTGQLSLRPVEIVRGLQATPGEYRRSQNWTGRPGSTLVDAQYVPQPPDQPMPIMVNGEEFLHNRTEFLDLIECVVMHNSVKRSIHIWTETGRLDAC